MASYTIKYESWHTIFDDKGDRVGKLVYRELPEPHQVLLLHGIEIRLVIAQINTAVKKALLEIPDGPHVDIVYHRPWFWKRHLATIWIGQQEYRIHRKAWIGNSLLWKKDKKVIAYSKGKLFGWPDFHCFAPIPLQDEVVLLMSIFVMAWVE